MHRCSPPLNGIDLVVQAPGRSGEQVSRRSGREPGRSPRSRIRWVASALKISNRPHAEVISVEAKVAHHPAGRRGSLAAAPAEASRRPRFCVGQVGEVAISSVAITAHAADFVGRSVPRTQKVRSGWVGPGHSTLVVLVAGGDQRWSGGAEVISLNA